MLMYDEATGSYDCVELVVSPLVPDDYKGTLCLRKFLKQEQPFPGAGTTFNVPNGSGPLVGAVLGPGGAIPNDVSFKITDPNGNPLTATPSSSSTDMMVFGQGNDVTGFVINSPVAGEWSVQISGSSTGDDYYFAMYTTPTQNADQTLVQTATQLLDPDALAAWNRKLGSDLAAMNCKKCRLALASIIAVLVAAIVGLGISGLATGSPCVVVIALLLGFSVAAVLAWIQVKGAEYGQDADRWLEGACHMAGYC